MPYETCRLEVIEDGHGPEAAARDARYRWFAEQLQADDVLLLAHHLDDQVETVLLRLLRGAGLDGLGAMAERRSIGESTLLRPFLHLPRAGLQRFAEEEGLSWVDDPSNSSSRFDRNYLRNEVLPLIAARWPGYRKTLGRAAGQLRAAAAAEPLSPVTTVFGTVGDPGFDIEDLPDDAPGASQAIRRWLKSLALPMPPASRLKEFMRQLKEGQGASLATDRYRLTRYRSAVYCHDAAAAEIQAVGEIRMGDFHRSTDLGELRVLAAQAGALPKTLTVRFRQPGDRIAGSGGQQRDLKDVFQELGIPPWWRERIPLICAADEASDRILALGPYYRSPLAVSAGLTVQWRPILPFTD